MLLQLNSKHINWVFVAIAMLTTVACSENENRPDVVNMNQIARETSISESELSDDITDNQNFFSLADLVEEVQLSVVSISVDIISRGRFFDFTDEGSGTGMIISNDGYIVTNYHVVQNASDIKVSLSDGRNYSAEIVGLDVLSDLSPPLGPPGGGWGGRRKGC